MTLVLNEIHLIEGLNKAFWIAGADRRLSKTDGSYFGTRKKLFQIPYINGAISYFGLAAYQFRSKTVYMSDIIQNFIRHNSDKKNISEFSITFQKELNRIIPQNVLNKSASGFHICGSENGLPDFWHFSNIGKLDSFQYNDIKDIYYPATSHFLKYHAIKVLNWDGKDPLKIDHKPFVYRNGDFRGHALTSEVVDNMIKTLTSFPDFNIGKFPEDYPKYFRFKFELIAYIYKTWAKNNIIAKPIDVVMLNFGI